MAVFNRKCKRCGGKGTVQLPSGDYGWCFGCANSEGPRGYNIVRTGADKVAHEERMRFVHSFIPQLRKRGEEICPGMGTAAKEGLWALLAAEPERIAKLRASVERGRLDDVVRALVAYK